MSGMSIPTLLARLGLSRYESSFLENGITEDLLPSLGLEELKELGVVRLGDRMQILDAVARLVPANALGPLVDRWPSVLAIPLQEYLAEENPVLKLWLACDVVEMLLRFIVMAGVAEVRTEEGLPNKLVRELRDRIEHPTLGKWQGMARAVVREVEPDRAVVPELRSYLEEVLVPLLDGTVAPATAETSFSRLRNTLAHGGGLTKSVARRLLGIWRGRFEGAVEKGAFLGDLSLRVRDASGPWGELRGTTTAPVAVDAEPDLPPSRDAESRGRLSLVRAGRSLDLWPLAWYGEPLAEDLSRSGFGDSPQVFVRRGEVRLEYTPVGSTGAARSVGEDGTLSAFLRFFLPEDRVARAEAREFVVRGFDGDFRKDADRLVGRAREVGALREAVDAANCSVIWVSGQAGVGKSYVVAKVATDLLDEAPAGTLVLPYRFRAGDDRCGRDPFVRYCVDRLEAWLGDVRPPGEADEAARTQEKPLERLEKLLERAQARGRVVLVLDGLDEIAERDANFAEEVPLSVRHRGGVWLCAGRPERGLPEAFERARPQRPFPDGLLPMSEAGIREMLLEKIGPLRKKLLRGDREAGEKTLNPFVERVAKLSEGLPIYVKYVVGDVLSGRISPDESARLPPSLAKYHEELLNRCAVGDLHAIVTPLVGTLAVAREPLTTEELVALLARRGLVTGDGGSLALVGRCLSAVASMVRLAPDPDGGDGYTLWHHSLRQHILESPETTETVATASRAMADGGLKPAGDAAERYLYRQGISHLLAEGRRDEALELMTDLGYLRNRTDALPKDEAMNGLAEDWETWLLRGLDPDDREAAARQCGARLATVCGQALSDRSSRSRRLLARFLLLHLVGCLTPRLGATPALRETSVQANRLVRRSLDLEPDKRPWWLLLQVSLRHLADRAAREGEAAARDLYAESLELTRRLVDRDPEDATALWLLSVAYERMGYVDRARDPKRAVEWYTRSLAIAQRLMELAPVHMGKASTLAHIISSLGHLASSVEEDVVGDAFATATEAVRRLIALEPKDPAGQLILLHAYNNLGKLDRRSDECKKREWCLSGLAIAEGLAALDPENTTRLQDLSDSYEGLGELDHEGAADNAREWLLKGLAIRERLTAKDPTNKEHLDALSRVYTKLFDLERKSNPRQACEWALKGLPIAELLVAQDPDNEVYLRALAGSYDAMGILDVRSGSINAREWFLKGLAIHERLAERKPDDAWRLKGLRLQFEILSELDKRTSPGKARDWCLKSLAIAERLAALEPDNTTYLRHLSVSYDKLVDLDGRSDPGKAQAWYVKGLTIRERLGELEPENTTYLRTLSTSYHKMGGLLERSDPGKAREWFLKGLALQQRLLTTGQADPDLLSVFCFNVAHCHDRLGEPAAAGLYENAIAIRREIVAERPAESDAWLRLANALHRRGSCASRMGLEHEAAENDDECVAALDRAEALAPEAYGAHYLRACFEATRGRPEIALEALRRAVGLGFADAAEMSEDDELISLRANPGFQALLKEIETKTKPADAGEKGTG